MRWSHIVGQSGSEVKVFYLAPPPSCVPDDMKRFLDGFNAIAPKQGDAISILTRAALAHLHLVQIHPFEDGNGRISRAIVDTAIAKALGMSTPVKMSHDIFESRSECYETLGRAGAGPMVTDW